MMNSVELGPRAIPADPHCHDCEGTGYVRVERFDLTEGEYADEVQVCQCVLAQTGAAE